MKTPRRWSLPLLLIALLVFAAGIYRWLRPSPSQAWLNRQGPLITLTISEARDDTPYLTKEEYKDYSIKVTSDYGDYGRDHYDGWSFPESTLLGSSDMHVLMNYFEVKSLGGLIGKTFRVPKRYATDTDYAFNLLLRQVKSGMQYVPPSPGELRAYAVHSLANGQVPDLQAFDVLSCQNTFINPLLMRGEAEFNRWTRHFYADIARESRGRYTLKEIGPESFSGRIRGPTLYLYLQDTSTGKGKRVMFIYGSPAFRIDPADLPSAPRSYSPPLH